MAAHHATCHARPRCAQTETPATPIQDASSRADRNFDTALDTIESLLNQDSSPPKLHPDDTKIRSIFGSRHRRLHTSRCIGGFSLVNRVFEADFPQRRLP